MDICVFLYIYNFRCIWIFKRDKDLALINSSCRGRNGNEVPPLYLAGDGIFFSLWDRNGDVFPICISTHNFSNQTKPNKPPPQQHCFQSIQPKIAHVTPMWLCNSLKIF